ncbi:MAG: dihydropteroate synthase [Bacteroidetes bacterium]|nr:dihydropteroate synthase [Bacteroidota bacterium]MDA1120288.1 dihydropteroate synthase [Bacteroidota bacterium]
MKTSLNIGGKLLDLSDPVVMGILNVTPDSFHSGSRVLNNNDLLKMATKMLNDGAAIIDIGGHSTRPGSEKVDLEMEINRVAPAINSVMKEFPDAVLSIDTFHSDVARVAIDNGASIINDISGGTIDNEMFQTVSELKVPYIMGHIQGNFYTMMDETNYSNLMTDLINHFANSIQLLKTLGVHDIVVDPCFGFSKTIDQNFTILKNLAYFTNLEMPILVGLSRKSMIYKFLEISPEEALNGTTVLNTIALVNGASILRVHDVKEAVDAIMLFQKTCN